MTTVIPRQFNIFGTCNPSRHYMLPALPRLPSVRDRIDAGENLVLHAPRQSGKTTAAMAFVDRLNEEDVHHALYCSLETLRGIVDKGVAMRELKSALFDALRFSPVEALKRAADDGFWSGLNGLLSYDDLPAIAILNALCAKLERDLVVFFDEADCLIGRSLLSFLSQLRLGYLQRPWTPFPRSIALIGMRGIGYYNAGPGPESGSPPSSSPFNIAEPITLPEFTLAEVRTLYAQHAEDTGQVFGDDAVQRAWHWSGGHPWLVNALAREVVENILHRDRGPAVTAGHVEQAAGNLMGRREIHFDSLLVRLWEPAVIEVMAPVFAGAPSLTPSWTSDEVQYCLDLGLVKADKFKQLRPANPMYGRLMAKYISSDLRQLFPAIPPSVWLQDDRLLIGPLLEEFRKIWNEYGSDFPSRFDKSLAGEYDQALHVFFLLAFLWRVAGGADVEIEYAQGRGQIGIRVRYQGAEHPIGLKATSDESPYDRPDSIAQLAGWMETIGAGEGWLMVFDQDRLKPWSERSSWVTVKFRGLTIHVVGC
jgi:hypothetical protein